MTNLDSIFKSREITLPIKVHPVKTMVFPLVMYGCESWTIKKAKCQRIDAFVRPHLSHLAGFTYILSPHRELRILNLFDFCILVVRILTLHLLAFVSLGHQGF